MGLPIPGFDFEVEAEPQVAQENSNEGQRGPGMVVPIQEPGNTTERVQSKTLTKRVPAIAAVKRLQISIILQEGAAPELIENIRQVVMVASRFDRTRGDVLSIMTASFKERRDEKSAEQVLLKNIADKLEMLQSGEGDDALTKSIEKEISGPLLDLKEQLNNLERRGAADKFEFERKTALLRDSLQLRALKEEITSLKNELSYANDARVDSQLTNRIATLDSMQMGLGQEIKDVESSSALIILVSILGALVVVLLVLVVILLLKKKQGPQQPQMPMPWPYPPPPLRRKKKRKSAPVANNEAQDDPDVIRGEIGEMRQSVVSMSVGQPKTATRIVKEWLEDDVVPEPEPPPEEPEEDSDKKKKKKK
jgi:flagellar biosynthesis/type III secretory pathway M-ring protein FliF/YscJ